MNYEFHPDAEQEFIETAAYYQTEVPGLGTRFGAEVNRVIELLLDNPGIGAPIDGEIRHFVLRRFPHSIIYAVISESLYILAVAHGSREPEYWQSRKDR
jgi:plasmid stabilization system protein ParE